MNNLFNPPNLKDFVNHDVEHAISTWASKFSAMQSLIRELEAKVEGLERLVDYYKMMAGRGQS